MKKVFIAAAFFAALGLNAANANTAVTPANPTATAVLQDEFKAIEIDSLPQAVKDSLVRNYERLTVKAAYMKETDGAKIYKITLVDADNTKTSDVLFNEKGEVLPAKKDEASPVAEEQK